MIKKKKINQMIQDKMEEARMEREGRVITKAFVNYFSPLAFLGFICNFIPQLFIFVPVDETEMCWFYFITKSPWQLRSVSNFLFYSSRTLYYLITLFEVLIMIYYTQKIRSKQFDLK